MIKIQNNSLVINTGISREDYNRVNQFAPEALKVTEESNDIYMVSANQPAIKTFGIGCNTLVNDNLAYVQVLPVTEDPAQYVRESYGKGLMAYTKHIGTIKAQVTEALSAIDSIEIGME